MHRIRLLVALPAILLLSLSAIQAQSGRSGMHGFVAFAGLSYTGVLEGKVRARIELRRMADDQDPLTVETDERGRFDFKSVAPGEYVLRISSPGYRTYETEIYLPSDFMGSLGVMLKKEKR